MLDRPDKETVDAEDGALTPHSVTTEQMLLGACLHDVRALDRIMSIVEVDDFYEDAHRRIYEAMRRTRDGGGAISIHLVALALGGLAEADLGGFTVHEYIAHLAAEAAAPLMAVDLARYVRTFSDRRRIISAALTGLEDAKLGSADPREIVENAIADLDAIAVARRPSSQRQVTAGEAATIALDASRAAKSGTARTAVTTGVRDLDRALGGGMQRGEFIVLAGRPGMGKTTLATAMLSAAARQRHGCYFASLEMNDEQLGARMLSAEAFRRGLVIPYNAIRAGRITEEEEDALASAAQRVNAWTIRIEQEGGLTMGQIAARARLSASRFAAAGVSLDLLVVDHLGLVKPSARYSGNRYAEVTEISGMCKTLAKELDVALVGLSQLSRQVEARQDKRPQLSDLRDSGSIEQDADVVLFAFREAYYLDREEARNGDAAQLARLEEVQNKLEIIVGKQRMGPTKPVPAYCSVACNVVSDLAQEGRM